MNGDASGLFIGLMSGTSIDAVDGVAVRFDAAGSLKETLAVASLPIPPDLRRRLTDLQLPAANELAEAALAANSLADLYADCVRLLLDKGSLRASAVTALAAHGQTIRHHPQQGYTVQLMNGARLAEATGIDTVTDLRSADIAAGGQGAPLVPAFHAQVFRGKVRRAIVNIGGIANITILERSSPGLLSQEPSSLAPSSQEPSSPEQSSLAQSSLAPSSLAPSRSDPSAAAPATPGQAGASSAVTGYDIGPGNTLLDAWCELHCGERFDRDGRWAQAGNVVTDLLDRMLEEPYFRLPPPKSTGRDLFNIGWLNRHGVSGIAPVDVQASLLELTVQTVAHHCRRSLAAEVYICGGGAANPLMMSRLQEALADVPVRSTRTLGMEPQAVEATAFAWLARQRIQLLPGSLPSVTGARGPRILGALHVYRT